jgi:YceI-like domain
MLAILVIAIALPFAIVDTIETGRVHLFSMQFIEDPFTFHSTKIAQAGPTTLEVQGTFTIRGMSKPETLTFTVIGNGTGAGEIKGTMALDRKDVCVWQGRKAPQKDASATLRRPQGATAQD